MKRALPVILALVMVLTLSIGSFSMVSATPGVQNGDSLSITQPRGGAYIHVTKLAPGNLEFNYGWNNSDAFAAPPASYWIGVYDVTASHYEWVTGWLNLTEPVPKLKLSQTVTDLVSGDTIKFVFFVRDQSDGKGNGLVTFEDGYPYHTVVFTAP